MKSAIQKFLTRSLQLTKHEYVDMTLKPRLDQKKNKKDFDYM